LGMSNFKAHNDIVNV